MLAEDEIISLFGGSKKDAASGNKTLYILLGIFVPLIIIASISLFCVLKMRKTKTYKAKEIY